jgi:hypothetical protein
MVRMKRFLAGVALCMCVALCFVACGSTEQGTVTGIFQVSGGPAGTPNRPLSGTVTLATTSGHTYRVPVSANGMFTVNVPTGRYKVTGHSPYVHVGTAEMTCFADNLVTVNTGTVAHVVVTCQIS